MIDETKKVRVRFAPSPTGYLHIGSARTALFNWLFAKAQNGDFILRIEDTDKKRSKKKYLKEIMESLKWLGMDWDGRPFYQSGRGRLYRKHAGSLIDSNMAYEVKGGAVAFRLPKDKVVIDDIVHGLIEFDTTLNDDIVILKSDGTPTYNFACVVDDIEMGITHVIRGDDHISNTPKQIALYRAFGKEAPVMAHIPLILGEDRSRLSKRHGATSIAEYRQEGYLPDAMVNFLALMGWSPGGNREVLTREEIIKLFTLDRIGRTSSIFDLNKLNWINGQHMKSMDANTLTDLLRPELKSCGYLKKKIDRNKLKSIVRLFKTRSKTLSDFCNQAEYVFVPKIKYDRDAVNKHLRKKGLKVIFDLLINDLEKVKPFTTENIERCCRDLIQRLGIAGGDLIHPARVAITGRAASPGLFEVIEILGKEKTIKRMRQAVKKYCL
jgi:glutamyl-tRNA synthetase